jgi:hypothetical protein
MKGTPFILFLIGALLIWLGMTGRLGSVLAAIFEPTKLSQDNGVPAIGGAVMPIDPYLPGGVIY